jgi:hypothetical protein
MFLDGCRAAKSNVLWITWPQEHEIRAIAYKKRCSGLSFKGSAVTIRLLCPLFGMGLAV